MAQGGKEVGQEEKNVEYEVKLYFAFLTCFFSLSPSLCLEKEACEGKWERENTDTQIRF